MDLIDVAIAKGMVNNNSGSGGIDTADATATAADILEDITAYVKGEKITGTIPNVSQAIPNIAFSDTTVFVTAEQQAGYVAGGTQSISAAFPEGYVHPSGTIEINTNGTYNVSNYASAAVNVEGSGGGSGGGITIDEIATKTVSGAISGQASEIASSAFANFKGITEAYFPNCTTIYTNAFAYCNFISSISFPLCERIESTAFYRCSSISLANFSLCTYVGQSAFGSCSNIKSANFPLATSTGYEAFMYCSSLESVNLPACISIGTSCFNSCIKLKSVYIPSCTAIRSNAFQNCQSLSELSIPLCKDISNYTFRSCYRLVSLYITGISSVPTLGGSSVFYSSPIGGYTAYTGRTGSVYVPSSLYESFLTAKNWSSISSRIVSV